MLSPPFLFHMMRVGSCSITSTRRRKNLTGFYPRKKIDICLRESILWSNILLSIRSPIASISSASTVVGIQPAPSMASFSSKGPNSINPEILKVQPQNIISLSLRPPIVQILFTYNQLWLAAGYHCSGGERARSIYRGNRTVW